MGVLTDDMTRLNDEVNALRNARHEFLKEQRAFASGSRDSVASMLAALNAERAETARDMRTRLHADRTERLATVREDLAANETQRIAEARRVQDVRRGFLSDVCGRVDDIRAGADLLRTMFRNAHAEMAGVQRENRAANDSRRCAAEENRVEEARQSSTAREGFLAGVRGQVDTLRAGVSRLRGEFAADMAGAHRAWGGAIASQEAKAKRPTAVKVDQKSEDKGRNTASVKAEERPAEKAADASPDDLTGIPGIGRSTQEHLNDAGIRTYAELAACNPGYLRTILEGSGRRGNVEEWIAEAAKLVKSESRAHRG